MAQTYQPSPSPYGAAPQLPPPPPPPPLGPPITVGDSGVGYIDSAIIDNYFRIRYDAAYNNERPDRAEFFWAWPPPLGPGLAGPETGVDYQDLSAYLELAPAPWISGFVEAPVRFIDPDIHDNTAGFADMNAGVRLGVLETPNFVTTFQFRTYIPTGDEERGLGTGHVSLEPALLAYYRATDRLRFEGEVRDWIPIDGTPDRAGNVIRYGLGASYDVYRTHRLRLAPVVEFVGWTVLDGMTNVADSPTVSHVEAADGDTIVNAKIGVRAYIGDCTDVYAGYGHALTGDRWYDDVFRIELRQRF